MEARHGSFIRRPTPEQPQGPFYPLTKPADADADLTTVKGKKGRAQGQIIQVKGQVLSANGKPVPDAEIEIWQANTFGRYTHPHDTNPAPLDPNFKGYGVQRTDEEGRYLFKTVKPGPYQVSADRFRTRHIHFIVTGKSSRLITQMYFSGEPLNSKDPILPNTPNKEDLIVKLTPLAEGSTPDALIALWDIVLWQT
ncbi:MAG: protocatechuate 3,4-dioxygenase [Chloroflexi bacterium]|nr:protocatechuate 3,4-dioxygenase [Chloroflexota bacterium]